MNDNHTHYGQFSEPALLLAFVLHPGDTLHCAFADALETCWGPILFRGQPQSFAHTDYYEQEMGSGLHRTLLAFDCLCAPENIADYKREAMSLEKQLGSADKQSSIKQRTLNIDVGYLDFDKMVLPSAKRGPFKIYGGEGIWLDMLLTYAKGAFHPTAWAFPDFSNEAYRKEMVRIREIYKKKIKG